MCIVGASGKFGNYLVEHALVQGYKIVGVGWERIFGKLDAFKGKNMVIPGLKNDRDVIREVIAGCDGVLTTRVAPSVERR